MKENRRGDSCALIAMQLECAVERFESGIDDVKFGQVDGRGFQVDEEGAGNGKRWERSGVEVPWCIWRVDGVVVVLSVHHHHHHVGVVLKRKILGT